MTSARVHNKRSGLQINDDQLWIMVLVDIKNQLLDAEELMYFRLHEPTEEEFAAETVFTGSLFAVILQQLEFDVHEIADETNQMLTMYVHFRTGRCINRSYKL